MKALFGELKQIRRGFSSRRAMILISTFISVTTLSADWCPFNDSTITATEGQTVASMEVSPNPVFDFVTDTTLFIAAIYEGQGTASDPKGSRILDARWKWTSSNSNVVELVQNAAASTQNAQFVARSTGSATVTVTLDDPRLKLAAGVSGTANHRAAEGRIHKWRRLRQGANHRASCNGGGNDRQRVFRLGALTHSRISSRRPTTATSPSARRPSHGALAAPR